MSLITNHGEFWPRNNKSFEELQEKAKHAEGIYVLRDGSMPMYIGMGKIFSRIGRHRKSKSKGNCWGLLFSV